MSLLECTCDSLYASHIDHQDDLLAGNLYFYSASSKLSAERLKKIMRRSVEYFSDVGISFGEKKIIQGSNFPKLSSLDVMLFFIDQSPSDCAAQYGTTPLQVALMHPKDVFRNLPYDDYTVQCNTGFIAVDDCVGAYNSILRASLVGEWPSFRNLTPETKLEFLASIATHEIGHAFTALDVRCGRTFSDDVTINDPRIAMHIEASPYVGLPKHFYIDNVSRMHEFIRGVHCDSVKDVLKRRDSLIFGKAMWLPNKPY